MATRTLMYRLGIIGLFSLTLAVGCVEETPALFIVHNALLGADCQPQAAQTAARSRGVMDITVARTYQMFMLVENVMSSSGTVSLGGSSATGDYEGNRVTLTTAKISFVPRTTDAAVRQCLLVNQEIGISGTLEPGQQAIISMQTLDHTRGDCLSGALRTRGTAVEMEVQIQFIGETASGSEVETNVFTYPMTVCRGCLISYPLAVIGEDGVPDCQQGANAESIDLGCFPGQDDWLDCRLCRILVTAEGHSATEVNASCEAQIAQ